MEYLNFLLPVMIILVPLVYYSIKYEVSKKNTIIWNIFTSIISLIILIFTKEIDYIQFIITIILCNLFNYFIALDYIDSKKIKKIVGIFILFYFSSIFQLIPVYIFNIDLYNLTGNQELYLTLFSDTILLSILAYIYRDTLINDFKKFKKNLYNILDTGFKYWFIGLIVMALSNIIISVLVPAAETVNEDSIQTMISGDSFISIITIGILAPIIEELVFRKSFREIFKNKVLYVLLSGLIFGSLHVVLAFSSYLDFFYIIPYSAMGIAFGYMYQKTDNIYTSMSMHIFHNTTSVIVSIIGAMMIL